MNWMPPVRQVSGTAPLNVFRAIWMVLASLLLIAIPHAPVHSGTVKKVYPVAVHKWGPELNGNRYFIGSDELHGAELWRTDGTSVGTWMVKDTIPGRGGMDLNASKLIADGTYLYFMGFTGEFDNIYRSDGTESGTGLLISAYDRCVDMHTVGDGLYAPCDPNGDASYEMYRVDSGALALIKEHAFFILHDKSRWSDWGKIGASASGLFFFSYDEISDQSHKLWRIEPDGSVNLVCWACIPTDDGNTKSALGRLWWANGDSIKANGLVVMQTEDASLSRFYSNKSAEFQGRLFFTGPGTQPATPSHLPWMTDGTASGTTPLASPQPGETADYSYPQVVGVSSTQLFFVMAMPETNPAGGNKWGLWVTDGSFAGTHPVTTEFQFGFDYVSRLPEVFDAQNLGYFTCGLFTDSSVHSICRSNGTKTGTERVTWGSFFPTSPVETNGRILFGGSNTPRSSDEDASNYLLAINPEGSPTQDLYLSVTGNGRVQGDVAGIDCNGDCPESLDGGTQLTLTAIPNAGEIFLGWEGEIHGWGTNCNQVSTSCRLLMNLDRKITASFSNHTYTVTPTPPNFGSIAPEKPQVVNSGESITFTLSPDTGFKTGNVTGCGGTIDGSTYTTEPIKSDCTVSATFLPNDTTCTASDRVLGPVIYADGDILAELAEGKLSTDGNITLEHGALVIYKASNSIELNQDFRAMRGSVFSAKTLPIACK